ncbi:hypothetical protein HW132_34930 [Brasilonema sp. CT11]|nr:hypothetical protein [Brasilonema sp. CT11]
MHKRFVNHCTIDITLIPDGSIFIKSGKEGADLTKPDMEFVETYHVLQELELPRTNIIYAGGGNLYLLAPIDETEEKLKKVSQRLNKWLAKEFQYKVFLALAHVDFN